MARKAKLPADLDPLATALEEARRGASFDALIHHEAVAVLLSIYPFLDGLAEGERRSAIVSGISRAAESGPITARSLKDAVRREETTLLGQPQTTFVLATHLSFTRVGGPVPRSYKGGIEITRHLPASLRRARLEPSLDIADVDRLPVHYSAATVKVRARTVAHAFQQAQSRLDLLRALWNYAHARRTIWESHSDPTAPIARIRLGRVSTLHTASGALASPMYWFQPDHRDVTSTWLSDADWQRMTRMVRSASQKLRRVPYRAEVERGLLQYGRALDATDMETAFLKLWSVLELLTGLGGERYDDLVSRTVFLFKPDKLTEYVLAHLRHQRNEIVHLGTAQEEMRPLVVQLKRYVERMLSVQMTMGRHFMSLDEAGRFMDHSASPEVLRRQLDLLERAARFRRIRLRRVRRK